MKINIYYEDKSKQLSFEVSDMDCQLMIEADIKARTEEVRRESKNKEYIAQPRSVQEIIDEEINKPTYNNNQKETRRHCSLNAIDPSNKYICCGNDILEDILTKESYEELYVAIKKLQPQQKKLLFQIYWSGMKQKDIADVSGVSKASVTQRIKRIHKILKKFLI